MSGTRVSVQDPRTLAVKDFQADKHFWTTDDAHTVGVPNTSVYQGFARKAVDDVLAGYNSTLAAYGPTGSGKTHSIFGSTNEPGLISLAAKDLFQRLSGQSSADETTCVYLSLVSIYNEEIRDVLSGDVMPRGGIQVMEHPNAGVLLPSVSRHIVKSSDDVEKLLNHGRIVRAISAIRSNTNTSRLSVLAYITVHKMIQDPSRGEPTPMISTMLFADLPGTEILSPPTTDGLQKVSSEKAAENLTVTIASLPTFARQLNRSIITFSEAIDGLSKGANPSTVNFGGSKLSHLMKPALCGNSRTMFLVHVAPVASSYRETMFALRAGERMKRLRTRPKVNYHPYRVALNALKEELLRTSNLKRQINPNNVPFSELAPADRDRLATVDAEYERAKLLESTLSISPADIEATTEKLTALRLKEIADAGVVPPNDSTEDDSSANLVVLHPDPYLAGVVRYRLNRVGTFRVLKPFAGPVPGDIIVEGLQLLQIHADLQMQPTSSGKLGATLTPRPGARVMINGLSVSSAAELQHGARILLGACLVMVYQAPGESLTNTPNGDTDGEVGIPSYHQVLRETARASVATLIGLADMTAAQTEEEERKRTDEELNQLKKELQECQAARRAGEAEHLERVRAITRKIADHLQQTTAELQRPGIREDEINFIRARQDETKRGLDAELAKATVEWDKAKQDLAQRENNLQASIDKLQAFDSPEAVEARKKAAADARAEKEAALARVLPLVNEANALCTELRQTHLRTSVKFITSKTADVGAAAIVGPTGVGVRVQNTDTDIEIVFSEAQFAERLFAWRIVYDTYVAHGEFELPQKEDENPFIIVPAGPQLLGTCRVLLQPLYYLLPVAERMPILDYKGDEVGRLDVRVIPLPRGWKKGDNEDDIYFDEDDLTQFVNESFCILLRVKRASGIPKQYCKDVFIRYSLFCDNEGEEQTSDPAVQAPNPKIDFKRMIKIDLLTKELVNKIHAGVLEIQVFGSVADDFAKTDPNWAKLANLINFQEQQQQQLQQRLQSAKSRPGSAATLEDGRPAPSNVATDPESILRKIQESFSRQTALEREKIDLEKRLTALESEAQNAAAVFEAARQRYEDEIKRLRESSSKKDKEFLELQAKERERIAKLEEDYKRALADGAGAGQGERKHTEEFERLNEEANRIREQELADLRIRIAVTSHELDAEKQETARLNSELAMLRTKLKETQEQRAHERAELEALRRGDHAAAEAAAAAAKEAQSKLEEGEVHVEELKSRLEVAEKRAEEQELELIKLRRRNQTFEEREAEIAAKEKEHEEEVRRLRQRLMQMRQEQAAAANQNSSSSCTIA